MRAGYCVKKNGAAYIICLKKELWPVHTSSFLGKALDVHIQRCNMNMCQRCRWNQNLMRSQHKQIAM